MGLGSEGGKKLCCPSSWRLGGCLILFQINEIIFLNPSSEGPQALLSLLFSPAVRGPAFSAPLAFLSRCLQCLPQEFTPHQVFNRLLNRVFSIGYYNILRVDFKVTFMEGNVLGTVTVGNAFGLPWEGSRLTCMWRKCSQV